LTETVEASNQLDNNDEFWEKHDILISAVDNSSAREYLDGKCIKYEKILLEAGVKGSLASTHISIPFIT
jgi:molybdopterin/thiamine biosynthesis adenylyltransferase